MRNGNRIILALALIATIAGASRAEAQSGPTWSRTESIPYLLGDVGPLLGATQAIRFGRTAGAYFTVTVDDEADRPVGGILTITDWYGNVIAYRPFCGTSGTVESNDGYLTVHLDAPGDVQGAHWFNGPGCTDIGPVALGATRGVVHVTYTGG
jgi:hypothetical protein